MLLSNFINTIAPRLGVVILDVHRAKIEPVIHGVLTKLKKQYERNKLKFLIVSPSLAGADRKGLVAALESLKAMGGARVIEVFAAEAAVKKAELLVAQCRLKLLGKLGVSGDSSTPLDDMVRALETRHSQLRQLYKTLASEILHLQGDSEIRMPGSDNPGAVRISEAKRRALDAINTNGEI